jgi:hypothetical protein
MAQTSSAAILSDRNARVAVWACYTGIVAVSFGVKSPPNLVIVVLAIAWVVTASLSIIASKGWRLKALLVVVVSAILMKNIFLNVLLVIGCANGSCV